MTSSWLERDFNHLWHPYTRFSTLHAHRLPVIVSANGIYLHDDQGRTFIDAISSWWSCSLGHSHPDIVHAIQEQTAQLQHSILGNLTHPQAIRLAERLARLMPTPDRHVLFASDGASAIEQAIKIAVQYRTNLGQPPRTRFACFSASYHGDTLGGMSLGYLETFHRPFADLLFKAQRLPLPHCPPSCLDHSSCPQTCLDGLLERLRPIAHELAAFVVEPLIQGAAGMNLYGPWALARIAHWCREHDVLLIVDEIATGFGRTGSLFAFEHAHIDPDIVCLGKALTAGSLPLSATIARDRFYHTFSDRDDDHTLQHGHTFCGNPIACAAANAALDHYQDPSFLPRIRERAAQLRESLLPLRAHPHVQHVHTFGLIGIVRLQPEAEPLAHRIRETLFDRGVLLRPLGPVLYLMPPLVITREELDNLLHLFHATLQEIS
ncbi:MAG TPA: adenosylmethionine--8-amino-7-oxononanoate transaminase [Kiritimatiellia bacterium]|nr:adenosylmethionine--8-amino-7-oxononanoate transaminase [Kiritimatiellia bacterium]